jgi:hypothetical protein
MHLKNIHEIAFMKSSVSHHCPSGEWIILINRVRERKETVIIVSLKPNLCDTLVITYSRAWANRISVSELAEPTLVTHQKSGKDLRSIAPQVMQKRARVLDGFDLIDVTQIMRYPPSRPLSHSQFASQSLLASLVFVGVQDFKWPTSYIWKSHSDPDLSSSK